MSPTLTNPPIREAIAADADALWDIFHAVVVSGDTYAFAPDTSRQEALAYWLHRSNRCYVAQPDANIVGTYILRPNQPGLGSHVANAAFMVSPRARGQGVGFAMGEHCLAEARRFGFHAMQFNFVVSTNRGAVDLWHRLGFKIIGTLPKAFRHSQMGFVDAYVMFQSFADS